MRGLFTLFICGLLTSNVHSQYFIKEGKFEILRIDSVVRSYIIYAKCNDSVYKIVSEKIEINDCSKIVQGETYDLKIESTFYPKIANYRHIGGQSIDGELIKFESGIIWGLFITESFKSLCYTQKL